MANYRHATDRWDWTVIAECPNNGEFVEGMNDPDDPVHIAIASSAENSKLRALEAVPADEIECGICGADLNVIVDERPAEVLR